MGSDEILEDLKDIAEDGSEEAEDDPMKLLEDRIIQSELLTKKALIYVKVLATEIKQLDANMKILIEEKE